MAEKRIKRPRDPVQLAKLIGDIATGQVKDTVDDGKNPSAVALGKRGGEARATTLSKKKRHEIAQKAAMIRWDKKPN